jgi:hypothetical protein
VEAKAFFAAEGRNGAVPRAAALAWSAHTPVSMDAARVVFRMGDIIEQVQ